MGSSLRLSPGKTETHWIGKHGIEKYDLAYSSENNFIDSLASTEEVSIVGLGQETSCFGRPWAKVKGGSLVASPVHKALALELEQKFHCIYLCFSHSLLLSLCLFLNLPLSLSQDVYEESLWGHGTLVNV